MLTVRRRIAVAAVLVALPLSGAAGCKSQSSGSGSSGGGPAPAPKTTNAPSGKSTGGSTDSVGTVNLTFRGTSGSDSVSCSSISSEFKVSADGGRIRWTTLISDHDPDGPVPGRRPEGVSVDPGSGTLDQGQSQVVRVRGSFDGTDRHFWVKVQAPNKTGSGGVTLRFNCR